MTYNVLKKPDVFYIGKQDENGAETIGIDYSAWVEKYGEGVITATFQGAEDAAPYDIVLTTANGIATWTVTDANTVAAGVGKLQLNYVVNDVEAKSLIWTVRVYPSMRASGEAPDGYQDWLTALQGLSAETQQNAQNAANSATEAEEYAEQAKASADSITGLTVEAETLPAGSSATASFDADTDKLSLGIPRGDKGEKGDTGQDGITPDLTIGTTETLPAGSSATATITGTKENPVLNLGIPQGTQGIQGERGIKGDTGATPDISIGTVETLNPDESATATITGTAEEPVLNLGIPKGDTGADGFSPSASVTKQDGDITITITDKDGTTSATLEVDDALDAESENPVQNQVIQSALWNLLPVDTASGAIASFPDGADDVPMLSLKSQIEPVQDLHGYDSPWPAGGGSNRWDEEWEVGIYNATTGQPESSSGNIRGKNPISVVASTAYYASISGGGTIRILYYDSADTFISSEMKQNAAFTTPSNAAFVRISTINYGLTYNNNIAINYPSTVTTYAPYSNECPISGHTGVNVQKRGKNLLDGSLLVNPTTDIKEVQVQLKANTTYTVSTDSTQPTAGVANLFAYKSGETAASMTNGVWSSQSRSVTVGSDGILIIGYRNYAGTQKSIADCNNQIELDSTATDYEAYQGETISQEFVDGQGNTLTVYGGESEIVGGKLTSRMAMVDMGDLTWEYAGSGDNRYFVTESLTNIVLSSSLGRVVTISSNYAGVTPRNTSSLQDGEMCKTINQGRRLFVKDSRYADATAFKQAVTGVQLCYELAEPIEYTLTPQEVKTYLGQNNIWNDCGDTEVTYRADIQKYVEKKVNG